MADELGGRYFREARFFLAGDRVVATSHVHEARMLMGYMRDQLALGGPPIQVQYATLDDGTVIRATMVNGQYQAQIESPLLGGKEKPVNPYLFYIVSAVDSLMRVFTVATPFATPAGVYGTVGDLEPISTSLPTWQQLDHPDDERFCKMQLAMGTYAEGATTRPDHKQDLGPTTGFTRYCASGYLFIGYYNSAKERIHRLRGRKLSASPVAMPVLSMSATHSSAEADLIPYRQWSLTDGSLENETDSWFSTPVGDVSVVYFYGQFPRSERFTRAPTQAEVDSFCFQVFCGEQTEGISYHRGLSYSTFYSADAEAKDIPLITKSPWYTSIPGSPYYGLENVQWGRPVDGLFKPNKSRTRATILLYSPAVYLAFWPSTTPPHAGSQLVHMDISGSQSVPEFTFSTEDIGQDVIAVDYINDVMVTVSYPEYSRARGLSTSGGGLFSSDGWLDEPDAHFLHDLDIRAHACLFATAVQNGTSSITLATYFVYGTNKVQIIHDSMSFSWPLGVGGALGHAYDSIPMQSTYYQANSNIVSGGEAGGPTFLLLPEGRALIFIRPMLFFLSPPNDGGHCQILLYSSSDNSLTDVTSQLIPNVGDLPYDDRAYPPWLDYGYIDAVSANLASLPIPT